MALQDILKKILIDAEDEAKVIASNLEAAKIKIVAKSKEIERTELGNLEKNTEDVLISIDSRIQSMARREKSKMILESKQQIIKDFLDKLQVSLEQLSDESYGKIIKKLLQKIADKDGTVFTTKSRVEVTKSLVPTEFDVVVNDEISGGFIFKSKTGAEIDNSFKSLIHSEFRSNLEMYFSEQLKFI